MRRLEAKTIRQAVEDLCIKANTILRKDVLKALKLSLKKESSAGARNILEAIIQNASIAKKEKLAICQDTGMPIVFLEVGQQVNIRGDVNQAVTKGIEDGYKKGYFRPSVIRDPLSRGRPQYSPVLIHADIVRGDKMKITVLPKGFGCENKSRLCMFKPTAGFLEIKRFILETVKDAGPDACPPYVVGVGIGGSAEYASLLAKKALLKDITCGKTKNSGRNAKLEDELLKEINSLGIGPMGLGGKTTALGVKILTYPTHIAGLPVAVNISCHALRSAGTIL
ncbi:MAG: fumarate hydratase [Candidatus Omnitrophota bacterium]